MGSKRARGLFEQQHQHVFPTKNKTQMYYCLQGSVPSDMNMKTDIFENKIIVDWQELAKETPKFAHNK
jgi:hypothetical protein